MNNNDKGNLLEDVVESIERFLLAEDPSIKDNNLSIERKKRIRTNGVLHEYDLFIKIDMSNDYESVYIFECKNWEANVDKNQIVVFSEKINAVNATRGFFIATSFTKDAIAQAALNQRIKLVIASESNNAFPLFTVKNGFEMLQWDLNITMLSEKKKNLESFDPSLPVSLDGKVIDLSRFINETLNNYIVSKYTGVAQESKIKLIDWSKNNIRPTSVGTYTFTDTIEIDLTGHELYSAQTKIYGIGIISKITFSFVPPKMLWHFNIENRGRVGYYEYPFSRDTVTFKLTGKESGNAVILLETIQGYDNPNVSFFLG